MAVGAAVWGWILKDWTSAPQTVAPPPNCNCHCACASVERGWSNLAASALGLVCLAIGIIIGGGVSWIYLLQFQTRSAEPAPQPVKGKKGLGVVGKTLELKSY